MDTQTYHIAGTIALVMVLALWATLAWVEAIRDRAIARLREDIGLAVSVNRRRADYDDHWREKLEDRIKALEDRNPPTLGIVSRPGAHAAECDQCHQSDRMKLFDGTWRCFRCGNAMMADPPVSVVASTPPTRIEWGEDHGDPFGYR